MAKSDAKIEYTTQGKLRLAQLKEEYAQRLEKLAAEDPDAYYEPLNTIEISAAILEKADRKFIIDKPSPMRFASITMRYIFFTLCFLSLIGLLLSDPLGELFGISGDKLTAYTVICGYAAFALIATYGLFAPAQHFPDYSRRAAQNTIDEADALIVQLKEMELNIKILEDQLAEKRKEEELRFKDLIRMFHSDPKSKITITNPDDDSPPHVIHSRKYLEMQEEENKAS